MGISPLCRRKRSRQCETGLPAAALSLDRWAESLDTVAFEPGLEGSRQRIPSVRTFDGLKLPLMRLEGPKGGMRGINEDRASRP